MKPPWDAILWWEVRRVPYNLAVGFLGLISLGVSSWVRSFFVDPGEEIFHPGLGLLGIVVYGVLANIFYTLGWATELLWSQNDTKATETVRPKVFRLFFIVSSLLTLSPAVLVPLVWLLLLLG